MEESWPMECMFKGTLVKSQYCQCVHTNTFEEEFDYSDKPTLMAFFVNSETLNNKDITDGEKQTYKIGVMQTQIKQHFVEHFIRLSLVNCPPVIFSIYNQRLTFQL